MILRVGNRSWFASAAAAVVVLAGCSSADEQPRLSPSDEARSAPTSSPTPSSVPGLPGDEALTPPPPDPAAAGHLQQLSGVPTGQLGGHLQVTVAGLASFDEDVSGTCTRGATGPLFEATLADGSVWRLTFGPDGATSSLVAPGVQVDQLLRGVELAVDDVVHVSAALLTEGTSETSGILDAELACA